jgi:hypothetical protein
MELDTYIWNYVKFTPEQATKAQTESKLVALLFVWPRLWVANVTTRPLYPRERPGTHCTYIGWVGPRAALDDCG